MANHPSISGSGRPVRMVRARSRAMAPFAGVRMQPSPTNTATTLTPGSSFLVSNQTTTWEGSPIPTDNNSLFWWISNAGQYDPNSDNYMSADGYHDFEWANSSIHAPDSFKKSLISTLSQYGNSLTVFIHGLGTTFDYAISDTAYLGQNLAAHGSPSSLVIGFDWPSYDETGSADSYATVTPVPPTTFPPAVSPQTSGTIRDNINGSRLAFANFLDFLSDIKQKHIPDLKLSLICHSEGNYMAMLGLINNSTILFDNILMVAADINNAAMRIPTTSDPYVGWGSDIASSATNVTIYYSINDDVLPASQFLYGNPNSSTLDPSLPPLFGLYHNATYGGRLGLSGPDFDQGAQISNVTAVDCSNVVNYTNCQALTPTYIPTGTAMHTSYFYIPQILADMASVIGGQTPANRQATNNPNSYIATLT